MSLEWQPCPQVVESLSLCYSTPEVDLFASLNMAQLPIDLIYHWSTHTGSSDAFTEDQNH